MSGKKTRELSGETKKMETPNQVIKNIGQNTFEFGLANSRVKLCFDNAQELEKMLEETKVAIGKHKGFIDSLNQKQ